MNSHDCREGLTAFGWMALLVLTVLTVALWGPEWLGTHSVKQPEAQPSERIVMLPIGNGDYYFIRIVPQRGKVNIVIGTNGLWLEDDSNHWRCVTTNIVWKGNQ